MADMVGGGTRTAKTIDALTQHMKDWTSGVAGVGDAMKSSTKDVNGWALAQSGLNVQVDKIKASFQAWAITLGEKLLPYVTRFISFLTDTGMPWLTRLSDWVDKQALPAFLKFSDWLVHQAIPGCRGLADTVEKNLLPPLGNLIGNVVGIVTQFASWVTQTDLLGRAVGFLSGLLGALVGWIADFVAGLRDGNPLVSTLVGLLAAVGTAIGLIKIEEFGAGLYNSFQKMQQGAGIVANLAAKELPNLSKALGWTKTVAEDAASALADIGTKGVAAGETLVQGVLPGFQAALATTTTDAVGLGKAITGVGPAAVGAEGVVKGAAVGMTAAMGIATLGFSAAAGVLVAAFLMAKDHVTLDFTQMGQAAQKV